MLSRDVNKLINNGEKGVAELYKLHIKYFDLIDTWADRLTDGDLLDEFELSQCMERLTGCLMKLGSTAGALEALLAEKEHGEEVKGYSTIVADGGKVKAQDTAIVKATARDSVSKIRKWSNDFRSYFYSAQSSVVTAQSRLKRLTVQKGAKRVDRTGETPINEKQDDIPCGREKPDHITLGEKGDDVTESPSNEW